MNDVAEIHGVDVNVYDTSGSLHVTSQPVVYREEFLSKKMHPGRFITLTGTSCSACAAGKTGQY